ncbi:MAG TPA: hypothetical protein H9717_06275 [Candidatus Eisenbergiella merdipullorum]|uniref:Uncharacterized protein n=1 Tax=Candidatus Eisenbergiella merdipullorum TaxID=2838553 RepID=A0A9D2I6N4_9FIRM|nr:hypothetical protein [Candidatus Eisenbergiella merdipullorum]
MWNTKTSGIEKGAGCFLAKGTATSQSDVDLVTTTGIEEDFRNQTSGTEILLYEDSNLDHQSAWETIQEDLPQPRENIKKLLEAADKKEQDNL